MNMLFSPLTRFVVVTLAGISFASLLIPQPSFAEPSGSNILQNLTPQDNNPLAPRSDEVNSTGSGIFDLLHRAQLGSSPWDGEEHNQELNDAAAAFRAKQQQMLQQQRPQQPTKPRFQVNTP
ncbi:MAG: hypothetical protein DSM106950_12640 [Stigonema ocellatum SAG 48.90 = DSM 106950]|nr:hypothetical protein [Stigonema ocellatum SAG 48.90 = DSM 106950]